ncbi:hypothetical protein ACHAWO_008196 [Cyclotella atomus]|uniref:Helicase-associated domain-containing protein n=1 Tax=Cyclotella atomus TaxID=382360 RepID=A0ABD3QAR3_9STRA
MVQTVTSFTYTYTTDLPADSISSSASSHCGILHGTRPSNDDNAKEASIFAWIDDPPSLDVAIRHLLSDGYCTNNATNNGNNDFLFIPYSSKQAWIQSYPHAKITLDARDGKLIYSCSVDDTTLHDNHNTTGNVKKNPIGIESHPNSSLSNPQRDLLHIEMYLYLSNLRCMLQEMEKQKSRMGNVCASSDSVGELMGCMMNTFGKVIECNVPGVLDNDEYSHGKEGENLLESIGDELEERLGNKTLKGQSHSRAAGLTFEEYYERLVRFKEEFGHVNVPNRYKDKNLANWASLMDHLQTLHFVHDVRRNKKDLDMASELNMPPPKKSKQSQYIRPSALTPQRISQLESLNFAWGVRNVPNHVSWEDRFKQLMEYYEAYGAWPPHSLSGGLGSWVKHQRRRWATGDTVFMEKYFPRLEEVGFIWRVKGSRNSDTSEHLMQNVDLSTDEQPFQHDMINQQEDEHPMYHRDEGHHMDSVHAAEAHVSYDEMVVGDEGVQIPAQEIREV